MGLFTGNALSISALSVFPSICLRRWACPDVSVVLLHKGASVMAPVTHKGIKAQSLSLSPRRHWQLGQGNNLIWYFMLEKSLSSQATFVLGFSSAPQPPERLYMTLTHFREHYGLKRDLSRQRRGLFVVRASFPARSFGCTLSPHLFAPSPPPPL